MDIGRMMIRRNYIGKIIGKRYFSNDTGSSKIREIAKEAARRRKLNEETAKSAKIAQERNARMRWLPYFGVGITGISSFFAFTETGRDIFDKYLYRGTPLEWLGRYYEDTVREFTDPISQNLLPDYPVEFTWGGAKPPRTLVLDFEDTLCHLEWSRKKGWSAAKRPGVDMFLARLTSYYEIVIFTNGNFGFLEPYVEALDPNRLVAHKLYRESTLYENGEHIKDLSKLNRDLSRVIIIDDQPLKRQKENGIMIRPFDNPYKEDTELLDLLPFLEDLAIRDVADVRKEIAKYDGKYIPHEFKKVVEERNREKEKKRAGTLAGYIRPKHQAPSAPAPSMGFVQQEYPGMTSKEQAEHARLPMAEEPSKASTSVWGSFLKK